MPANKNSLNGDKQLYFHVFREVLKENIFLDNNDYQIFTNFLKEYFSDPKKIFQEKKSFTIRGRTYKGTPHQPQNFFNQLELIAYKLEPDRFDFVIKQITPGTLEKFIRAISTRYALYFNKRYNRKGALFNNPYTLTQINDLSSLINLTRNIHNNFSKKEGIPDHYYSSYPEYLRQRATEWIVIPISLSSYSLGHDKPVSDSRNKTISNINISQTKSSPKIAEIMVATIILFILSSFSLIKINSPTIKSNSFISPIPKSPPQVSGIKDSILPSVEGTKSILVIKTINKFDQINLYKAPSIESEIITEVNNGEAFELLAEYEQWYKIKINRNSSAFVQAQYSEIRKEQL